MSSEYQGEVYGPPAPVLQETTGGEQATPPRPPVKWTKSDALVFGMLVVGSAEMMVGVGMDSGPVVAAAGLTLLGDVVLGTVKLVRTINAGAPEQPPAPPVG